MDRHSSCLASWNARSLPHKPARRLIESARVSLDGPRAGGLMRSKLFLIALCTLAASPFVNGQQWPFPARPMADPLPPLAAALIDEGIKSLVGRLELEK